MFILPNNVDDISNEFENDLLLIMVITYDQCDCWDRIDNLLFSQQSELLVCSQLKLFFPLSLIISLSASRLFFLSFSKCWTPFTTKMTSLWKRRTFYWKKSNPFIWVFISKKSIQESTCLPARYLVYSILFRNFSTLSPSRYYRFRLRYKEK